MTGGATQKGGSAKASKKAVNKQKYIIDASAPSQDKIFDSAAFVMKINGRTGQLGEFVSISRSEDHKITITTNSHVFSKRYMKYLTKKFMKQHRIRDWLRVVATDPSHTINENWSDYKESLKVRVDIPFHSKGSIKITSCVKIPISIQLCDDGFKRQGYFHKRKTFRYSLDITFITENWMATKSVENPHEEQQKTLLNRIVSNVKKLNDVLEDMNGRIQ
ncbi:11582_t:CDS:2, partial [Dentiscutata erythropus]